MSFLGIFVVVVVVAKNRVCGRRTGSKNNLVMWKNASGEKKLKIFEVVYNVFFVGVGCFWAYVALSCWVFVFVDSKHDNNNRVLSSFFVFFFNLSFMFRASCTYHAACNLEYHINHSIGGTHSRRIFVSLLFYKKSHPSYCCVLRIQLKTSLNLNRFLPFFVSSRFSFFFSFVLDLVGARGWVFFCVVFLFPLFLKQSFIRHRPTGDRLRHRWGGHCSPGGPAGHASNHAIVRAQPG